MGINCSTGGLLVGSVDEEVFAGKILESLQRNAESIRRLTQASQTAAAFKGEVERERMVDLGDPRAAGWMFLVNGDDPHFDDIIWALRPLATHRGMTDPEAPLVFNGEAEEEWYDWLLENYSPLDLDTVPHYILIVGGPEQVPFHFQSFLDSAASVGRVDFESMEDLETYVEKIVRLEEAASPVVTREAVFFATEDPPPPGYMYNATYFSRRYMVEPLAEHVRTRHELETRAIMGEDATKEQLLEALRGVRPAPVYTASHGLGAPDESLEIQKRFNGAICCRRSGAEPVQQWLWAADDVPFDEPFLEGGGFFQFACFGYGTPAESDFEHWLGDPQLNAEADFVAALPKRLLAHPRGPVAFIGHTDTAWLHGFADPESPLIMDRWHRRIAPFVSAIDMLLRVQPTGLAMAAMNKRYDVSNALLTSTFDRLQKGRVKITPDFQTRLAQTFIARSDAQNYLIFGDSAARLRIPAG